MAVNFSFGNPTQGFKFDTGPNPAAADLVWNQNADWGTLWAQVMNQLGITNQGSNFAKWFQQQAGEGQQQYKVASALDLNLQPTDFLNQYVPGIGSKFGMQSAQQRGEDPRFVGRPRFLA
jgi:hypothetical protein